MSPAITTYRVLHPETQEPIYQTTDADTAAIESKSGHIVTAVSQGIRA